MRAWLLAAFHLCASREEWRCAPHTLPVSVDGEVVTLNFTRTSDVKEIARAFVARHNLSLGESCADPACVIDQLLASMERRAHAEGGTNNNKGSGTWAWPVSKPVLRKKPMPFTGSFAGEGCTRCCVLPWAG